MILKIVRLSFHFGISFNLILGSVWAHKGVELYGSVLTLSLMILFQLISEFRSPNSDTSSRILFREMVRISSNISVNSTNSYWNSLWTRLQLNYSLIMIWVFFFIRLTAFGIDLKLKNEKKNNWKIFRNLLEKNIRNLYCNIWIAWIIHKICLNCIFSFYFYSKKVAQTNKF